MALVSLLSGLAGGIFGNKAADAQAGAADDALELQERQFGETKSFLEPFQQRGLGANRLIDQALGIGFNTPQDRLSASDSFIQNFQDSPLFRLTFQTGLDEASDAILAGQAARGVQNSGATLKALQDRGSDIANRSVLQQLALLQNTSNQGAGAASSLAGASQNFGNAASDLTLQRGNAEAAGFLNTGNTISSTLQDIVQQAGQGFGAGSTGFSRFRF